MKKEVRYISQEVAAIIGAELKRRRLACSRTLEDSDRGCSISYLSKIENGKIIPKYNVLLELCEKNGITEKELESLTNIDEKIALVIESLFWQNKTEIGKIYDDIYMFDNYKCNLVKLIYEMGFLHWDKVQKHAESIYSIKGNLENNDFYLYTYLLMCLNNKEQKYPEVYSLFKEMKNCKNEFLLALASKEMFKAVCYFGIENPVYYYEEFSKRYISLLNYSTQDMYDLLIETLIKLDYVLPDSVLKHMKKEMKLQYFLTKKDVINIDLYLKEYKTTQFEKLLIYTVKKEYALAEKSYTKIELYKMNAEDIIVANYCNILNSGNLEFLADFIINTGLDYAKKINNGHLFKLFLHKLSDIAFSVGRYKTVAAMNLVYFDMVNSCRLCML